MLRCGDLSVVGCRRALYGICLFVALGQVTGRARAQEIAHGTGSGIETERAPSHAESAQWYGWQTLITDTASFGLLAAGVGLEQPALSIIGVAGYVIGAPSVHLGHRNDWALASFLLRLAGPGLIAGGLAIAFISCPLFATRCSAGGQAAGLVIALGGLGLVVAMPIIDALLAVKKPARSRVSIAPWLTPRADAAGLALVARL